MGISYNPKIVNDNLALLLDGANVKSVGSGVPDGQQTYTSAGTYNWTCPANVTSVSVVCIGGGGGGNGGGNGVGGAGGGGGGGLGYKNNIPVTPGQSYTVVVGGGGSGDAWDGPPFSANPANDGGDSYFINATTVKGGGGGGGLGNSSATGGSGGTYVGDGGGNGYSGGTGSGSATLPATGGGGGSTGTYTGNATTRGTSKYISSNCTSGCLAGNGTGQGLLGTGSSGLYGRGGGANMETFANGTSGYTGAVRIMWGIDRSYPSTNVADSSASAYPTWYDLSGKSRNGTVNDATFNSAGYFDFDGTNDYIQIDNFDTDNFSTEYSFSIWMNSPTSVADQGVFSIGNSALSSWPRVLFQADYETFKIYLGLSTSSYHLQTSFSKNSWNNFVMTKDSSGNWILYKNGSQADTYYSTSGWHGSSTNGTTYLGVGYNAYFYGKISSFMYYDKKLSADEVRQNFNAYRGRFGI